MKKYFSAVALGLSILTLVACQDNNPTKTTTNTLAPTTTTVGTTTETVTTTETTTDVPTTTTTEAPKPTSVAHYDARFSTGTLDATTGLPLDIQDGTILHAWNWSYNTIKANLANIAKSGYTAVQTSPVQQSKSSVKTGAWTSEWYKLYQPVSFSVAADSYLGTKEELKEMCDAAEEYGIKVIVDIVSNHLGNDSTGEGGTYAPEIETYEPEIYANRTEYFHHTGQNVSDTNAKTVTRNMLSNLPDLNTAKEFVQGRVISLLEECIDAGVDGFRFDAAKHIETPDDGSYASNFWPNVLNTASSYADETYGTSLYYYGEVLNTPGGGRSFDSYTKYMSVTDSKFAETVTSKLNTKQIVNYSKYSFSEDGTKAVVWAESHDTYADGSSSAKSQELINRVYAFEAARGGAAPLYFARPNSATAMGAMGSKAWMSSEIIAVNNFHNKMIGLDETISFKDSIVAIERGNVGAVLISGAPLKEEKEISYPLSAVADGVYYDQVTGNEVIVENGILTGTMSLTGIIVLGDSIPDISPEITVSSDLGYFYETYDVTINTKNASSATYCVNGGTSNNFVGSTTVTLTPNSDGEAILTVTALRGEKEVTEEYHYYQIDKREGYVAISGLKDTAKNKYIAWVWPKGRDGHWEEVVIVGDVAYIAIPKDESGNYLTSTSNYLLAAFPADGSFFDSVEGASSFDDLYGTEIGIWDYKTGQTGDYSMQEDTVQVSTI